MGCITKLHVPPQKPRKKTYRSLKSFNETDFVLDVSQITFHISSIFDDVGDQYCLFTAILNEHAPLKTRSVKENHLSYMHSYLRTNMYKRNMLKMPIKVIDKIIVNGINLRHIETNPHH